MIDAIKKWYNAKFIGFNGWSKGSAAEFISLVLHGAKPYEAKIQFIFECIESDDKVVRTVINDVIDRDHPQLKKVLKEPWKYKILL